MTAPAMKPCPHCGMPGVIVGGPNMGWLACCEGRTLQRGMAFDGCGAATTVVTQEASQAAAIWNNREASTSVNWLPIALAPLDGTRLMLWDSVSKRPVFGSWRPDSCKDHGPITHYAAEPAGPKVP